MTTIFDIETDGIAPFEKLNERNEVRQVVEHRIISIGVMHVERGICECFCGDDEADILRMFFAFIENENTLVGFNCEFDLNFIRVRTLVNNVKASVNFKSICVVDLRNAINNYKFAVGTLSDYAKALNLEVKTQNGEMMPFYFKEKNWLQIKNHNLEDVQLTLRLYQQCKGCGLI